MAVGLAVNYLAPSCSLGISHSISSSVTTGSVSTDPVPDAQTTDSNSPTSWWSDWLLDFYSYSTLTSNLSTPACNDPGPLARSRCHLLFYALLQRLLEAGSGPGLLVETLRILSRVWSAPSLQSSVSNAEDTAASNSIDSKFFARRFDLSSDPSRIGTRSTDLLAWILHLIELIIFRKPDESSSDLDDDFNDDLDISKTQTALSYKATLKRLYQVRCYFDF
ncbi:unnamed protein product [Protopolystoma xenopodis]|uniref:Uncharacterized protein n=1 Tax=Protopolystoma xenopodis TaxID=117903 RepID=A0A3S5AI60_9PLAT|nr:unnamed protein product [Protopolystoma xenopodis]